jgi:hypothetical protein
VRGVLVIGISCCVNVLRLFATINSMPFHWVLDTTNPNENQDAFSLSMKKVDYPMPLSLSHYPIFMEETKSCKIILNHWAKESQG